MATQVPKNGDFSQLLGPGENLLGFVAQTPNGTLVNGHGGDGYSHPYVEADGGWIKINPLVAWPRERLIAEFERRGLPPHPLEAEGFLSIGCMPCSERTPAGSDIRSGRWAGSGKTECGIHRRSAT